MSKKQNLILLYGEKGEFFLVKPEKKRLNTNRGFLELQELSSKDYGDKITTSTGYTFYIIKPTIEDVVMKGVKRFTQIIYPKDASLIVMKAGIGSGSRIIEVGTGSGAFTIVLASVVKPKGKVYTYEKRKEFIEKAKRNVEEAGLSKYVEFKHKEVKNKFDEKNVDFIMLDLPTPWELINAVKESLSPGRKCACILPTINQVENFVFSLKKEGFVDIRTYECWVREILVREGKTRPQQLMPSHTGYLVFATKIKAL